MQFKQVVTVDSAASAVRVEHVGEAGSRTSDAAARHTLECKYDHCFDMGSTQADVYSIVRAAVKSVIEVCGARVMLFGA